MMKALLLAATVLAAACISACSGPGFHLVADAGCHPEAAASPDATACHVRWDPSESAVPRPDVYLRPMRSLYDGGVALVRFPRHGIYRRHSSTDEHADLRYIAGVGEALGLERCGLPERALYPDAR